MKARARLWMLGGPLMALPGLSDKLRADAPAKAPGEPVVTAISSLDGEWQLALDRQNTGKKEEWFHGGPVSHARPARVPGVVDLVFPGGYEGVMWYWKEFDSSPPRKGERIFLKFYAADYLAEVWVNGKAAGRHEGGDTPFAVDVNGLVQAGKNRLVVRVVSPGDEPVDGLVKKEIPQGYKNYGLSKWHWNPGGLWQTVELVRTPATRVADIFADARWPDGYIDCQVTIVNGNAAKENATLHYEVQAAAGGPTVFRQTRQLTLSPGETVTKEHLAVPGAKVWSLDDPFLYRVTVRLASSAGIHEDSVRVGFRNFVFADGYFRLNGKRVWLKSCHNSQHYPIGQHIPLNLEMLRREVVNLKAMGFNMVRLPWRSMHPLQLELCDELGLMVYQEHYASWLMEYSPRHNEWFDRSISETILRDRNHPSIVMRGLLNETDDGPRFRHAVEVLPLVRRLDPHRLILLNSGRDTFDHDASIGSLSNPGSSHWDYLLGGEDPKATSAQRPGDVHKYCPRPTPAEDVSFLRNVGSGTKNIWLSEFGHGNQMDLWELTRLCEQSGADPDSVDAKLFRSLLDQFESAWRRYRLDEIYATPSDLAKEAEEIGAQVRAEDIDMVRSNPKIAGYSLTAWSDEGYESQGIATLFREPKRGMFEVFRRGFAPIHWSLFAGPTHVYRGARISVEAVLANEDAMKPGSYPARLRIIGPASVAYDKTFTVTIPDPNDKPEPGMVIRAFQEEITLDGPPGKYEVAVFFERGAAARARQTVFVGDAGSLPKPAVTTKVWETDGRLAAWLRSRALPAMPFDSRSASGGREMVLVNGATGMGDETSFRALAARVSGGSVAIILNPDVLIDPLRQQANAPKELNYLPTAHKVRMGEPPGGWEGHDMVIRRHPIFEGLPAGCLMDVVFYRDLIPQHWFSLPEEVDATADVVVPGFILKGNYSTGPVLAVIPHGEGKFIVSTLLLAENLGKCPAADRIVLNMLGYAASLIV